MSHTILVVDDEADVRAFLTAVLEKEGHRVVTATDGRQALEVAAKERPDLIVLDLQMPEQTGTDFYRRLTKDEALRNTPIIVVSGVAGRHLAVTQPVRSVRQAHRAGGIRGDGGTCVGRES